MKIATGQYASVAGDIEANVATAVAAVESARGARVLVLPELFLTGYALPPAVIELDDPRLAPLDEAATGAGTMVLVGAAVAGPDRPTLSLLAVGGGVRRIYDKLHLCGAEQDYFDGGSDPVVLEIDGWRLGLAICYDGCFPEHARALADAGADAYVSAIAYYAGSEHRRDLYYRSRALDNGFYAVVSGLVGECGGAVFNGGTAIHDPEGRTVAAVEPGEVGTVTVELSRDLIDRTRSAHPMLAERRQLGVVRHLATG